MIGHHCIIVQDMVTRTYATYYWIRKELMWTLSIRWVHVWPQILNFIRTEIINLKNVCAHTQYHIQPLVLCYVVVCPPVSWVWVCGWVCDCASYILHMICILSTTNCYALVGRLPEEYGSCHVCLSVCLCVILQCAFVHDRNKLSNENCNATITQHSPTIKLARFLLWGFAFLQHYCG